MYVSYKVIIGEDLSPHFLSVFDQILFILADNNDIHKSLGECGSLVVGGGSKPTSVILCR